MSLIINYAFGATTACIHDMDSQCAGPDNIDLPSLGVHGFSPVFDTTIHISVQVLAVSYWIFQITVEAKHAHMYRL